MKPLRGTLQESGTTIQGNTFGPANPQSLAAVNSYSTHLFLHIKRTSQGIAIDGEPVGMRGHQIRNANRAEVDGVFVEWGWDGQTLHVRNDRYGFQPLFYYANTNEIAISDSIHILLAAG